jgi:hypothetical protein
VLAPEQRRVGAAEQLVGRRRGVEVAQAGRYGQAHPVAQRRVGDELAGALGGQQRGRAIALDEGDPELVGARAGDDVLVADRGAEESGDGGEALLALLVADPVGRVADRREAGAPCDRHRRDGRDEPEPLDPLVRHRQHHEQREAAAQPERAVGPSGQATLLGSRSS